MTKRTYPTMKTKTIKLRYEPDMHVDATIDTAGRPIVVIDSEADLEPDTHFSPVEAERLGRALIAAAAVARAKVRYALAERVKTRRTR